VARVLVVVEHDGQSVHLNTAKCVTCGLSIGVESVDAVVFADTEDVVPSVTRLAGVGKVLAAVDKRNQHQLSAMIAPQLAELAREYTHVLAPSSTFGKDLLPRAAALAGTGQLSDILEVEGPYRFKRPVYAGNGILTVEARSDRTLFATVRTASFKATGGQDEVPVETLVVGPAPPEHTQFIELRSANSARADLQTSARVVSGGRGLGSADGFQLVYRLADLLGAAVGASRAAVDSGFAANELQVGQTGKIIAPDLYLALGVSGAIQHVTGIQDAGTIVAINRDADAPIFDIADIGLAADLFEAVPQLIAALQESTELG
jgi:electron transfer flavoprotein alpha subunit